LAILTSAETRLTITKNSSERIIILYISGMLVLFYKNVEFIEAP
jgi:hypothetical protein